MFVTSEQKARISDWLTALSNRVSWLTELSRRQDAWERDLGLRMASERAMHTCLEYMTDISSLVIDALVMRDPGGYADIVKVLVEEDVLSEAWFRAFEPIFEFRTRLLRDFHQITPEEVRNAVDTYTPMFLPFVEGIQTFLDLPAGNLDIG
ncbi:DUF86 domain-containing protein [Alicyclobacillus acidiphilus]|uniref:DUF86 domain-containing protein n=1 Tax=Alicyclobacillus acidiphilus TaxID=182455 RepID=UPI00082B19C8|nr:HepT-like ribonuclease domain-containing protein [Alicyclobacillus acidiphilus]